MFSGLTKSTATLIQSAKLQTWMKFNFLYELTTLVNNSEGNELDAHTRPV